MKEAGVKRFGLHTMVASNELDPQYIIDTATLLFDLVAEISAEVGIEFEFINIGGGIGIPYRPDQKAMDLEFVGKGIEAACKDRLVAKGLPEPRLYMECGRCITGPYGYLVSRVRHVKKTYKTYIGLDACMANLMRPALYGAYHHITLMAADAADRPTVKCDVTGSLCENNDKFAIDRMLPRIDMGDLLVIHDTGAHGHAMGYNYNGKLRSAEVLLKTDGSFKLIRRAERPSDYFATFDGSDFTFGE
jgi:diaminopimelate decarboxylase